MPLDVEPTITPNELAKQYGWSSRALRKKARELGACHVLGRTMVLMKSDVEALLEATRVRPLAPLPRDPWPAAGPLLPGGDYETLQRLRLKQEREEKDRRARLRKQGVASNAGRNR